MTNPLPRLALVEDPPWRAMIVPTAGTSALATPTAWVVGPLTGVVSTELWAAERVSGERRALVTPPPPISRPARRSKAPRRRLSPGLAGVAPGCGGGAGT